MVDRVCTNAVEAFIAGDVPLTGEARIEQRECVRLALEDYQALLNGASSLLENRGSISLTGQEPPKNVIIVLRDGADHKLDKVARILARALQTPDDQQVRSYATDFSPRVFALDQSRTGIANPDPVGSANISDSAAGFTSVMCGIKTNNKAIAVDENGNPCEVHLRDLALSAGKKVAVITTTSLDNATPAVATSSAQSRSDRKDIVAGQAISGVHILVGGSSWAYDSAALAAFEAAGYAVYKGWQDFAAQDNVGRAVVFAHDTEFPYVVDRMYQGAGELLPSKIEMIDGVLDQLEQDPDGYFLIFEGGVADFALHKGDVATAAHETLDDLQAVDHILERVMPEDPSMPSDTLVVVVGDHPGGNWTAGTDKYPSKYTWAPEATEHFTISVKELLLQVNAQRKTPDQPGALTDADKQFARDLFAKNSPWQTWDQVPETAQTEINQALDEIEITEYKGKISVWGATERLAIARSRVMGIEVTGHAHSGGYTTITVVGKGAHLFHGVTDLAEVGLTLRSLMQDGAQLSRQ